MFRCVSSGVVIALLCALQSAHAQATPPEMELVTKGYALSEDLFAIDPNGVVYLGEHWQHTILTLDPATRETTLWEGPLPGSPRALIFGPDGRAFFICQESDAIFMRPTDGPSKEIAAGLPWVTSLAMNKEGRLFATQSNRLDAALYEIDPDGVKPPRKIGLIDPQAQLHWEERKAAGGCGMPNIVQLGFAPDGQLYALYDRDLVALSTDTAAMTHTGITARTFGFGTDGGIYVANSYLNKPSQIVERIDLQSKSRVSLYTEYSGGVSHLTVDAEGDLVAAIHRFGELVLERPLRRDVPSTVLSTPGVPTDTAIYAGEMYIAEGYQVRKVNLATGASSIFAAPPQFDGATGIDVSEKYVHTVRSGVTAVHTFDRKTGALVATRPLKFEAFDVLEMDDGSLILLSFTRYDAVLRLPPLDSGETEVKPVFEDMFSGPSARLARADAEHVYVNEGSMGLLKLNINTGVAKVIPCDLNSVGGMATLPNGDLLVVEANMELPGRVTRVRPPDGHTEIVAALPDTASPNALLGGFFGNGIAVTADGTIYVVSATHQAVYKLSTT